MEMSDEEVFARFIRELNHGYQDAMAVGGAPEAAMLAVGAECGKVAGVAARVQGELYVAMDNCPHQAVLVGERSAVEEARALVQEQGWIYEFLTFDRAYHTPAFAPYTDYLRQAFAQVPIHAPRLPIYSCTTAAPYPSDPEEIQHLMIDHWVRPVEFRRTVEALYADNVRVFVEVGPRGNLTAFVEDILRGRPFCAAPVNVQHRSGITQLNHCVALLTAQGIDLDLTPLYMRRRPQAIAWDSTSAMPTTRGVKLPTGFAVLRLSPALAQALRAPETRTEHAGKATAGEPWTPLHEQPEAHAVLNGGTHNPAPTLPSGVAGPIAAPTPQSVAEPVSRTVVASAAAATNGASSADDEADMTVLAYLETMDHFVAAQDEVMRAFLAGNPAEAAEWLPHPAPPSRRAVEQESPITVAVPGKQQGRAARFPLLGNVIAWRPGHDLVAQRDFDPDEDLYLHDHTLGRTISETDPDLLALAVLPLTMGLEIMAEAAACLLPGMTVVGMRDVRAFRWIAFDGQPQTLQIAARVLPDDGDRVQVQVRNLTEDARTADPAKSPALEATVLVARSYAPPSAPQAPLLRDERSSRWHAESLYGEAMFHGPRWQGVATIERTGSNGTVATLPVLPFDRFFRSTRDPSFVLDPVVLDAAGQVIGFWTLEHLASGRLIFPFRVGGLDVYGPRRPAGEMITCTAAVSLVGTQQVSSDIDMLGADGRLWMRLTAWEDKRFEVPAGFHRQLLAPHQSEAASAWPEPLAHLPRPERFQCRRAIAAFPSDQGFWKLVWAHCILSRAEREQFRHLRAAEGEQLAWLAGRAAAKEAVRQLMRAGHGRDLLPADIEISIDETGRPTVGGAWCDEVTRVPLLSIAQTEDQAVALAVVPDGAFSVGMQIGRPGGHSRAANAAVYASDEQDILARVPVEQRDEWHLLGKCAKEAVARALGFDESAAAQGVAVTDVAAAQQLIVVRLRGRIAASHPELARASLAVYAGRYDDLIVATTLCERVSDTERRISITK
jgi:malonyl CoA-acyl carrier protein transacylase